MNLHNFGSSLITPHSCLKVPHLSVQTIIHKHKHHEMVLPSWCSANVKMCVNARTKANDVVKIFLKLVGECYSLSETFPVTMG